jgi:biopolymer transport protein ExbD
MIDVVFLLLVFFLCTSTFETPEEDLAASLLAPTNQPGAVVAETAPPELEDVILAGRYVEGQTLWTVNDGVEAEAGPRLVALLTQLASIDRALPVTIDSSGDVPLGDVVAAYDAARAAGFAHVQMIASANAFHAEGDEP